MKKVFAKTNLQGTVLFKLIAVYCLLTTVNSQAQFYPVNAQMSVAPPYSLFLTDYGMGSNIMLNLIQRDVSQNGGDAYLSIELEANGIRLKTLPTFRPSTYVDIVPGVMHMLSNSDLAEYFNINSLSFEGISREAFIANGYQLPEGFYKFKIKAYFRFTGTQASNEAIAIMSLQRGQPPIINQPFEKAKVPENAMQNFNISWTARSVNPTSMPSYRLQMWEMLDPSQDPNIIVNSNYPPILDEFTNFSTFQYGMSQTPLTAGKSYVIRVQVLDPEGRDVYANGGYSQVRRFTYGDPCDPPTNLTAITDNRGIQVNWALTPNQGGYRFQHARIDTAWTDVDVLINRFSIEKTYPSAQYQMRVATVCSGGKQSEYSEIVYVSTTPSGSNNQCVCGGEEPKINITNKKLLQSLKVGDKFTAYDFDVTVTQVFRNDSTSYKGEGKTPFMMLGGVDVVCYFDGLTINTDHRVIKGEVRLQSKPYVFSDKNVKQFKEDYKDTQEMLSQNDASTPTSVNVDVTIGTVTYDSTKKEIIVSDAQGNTAKTLSSGKDYKITDKDGNVFLVSKDNKVSKQPKATEAGIKGGGPVKEGGENYDIHFTTDQPILTFEAHPQQTWGFDSEPMNSMVKTFYESIINTQRAYYVPYKSIGSAGTDKVIAKVERNPEDVDLKRIKFKTNAGQAVPFEYDAEKEEWTLTITAGLHRNDFSVFPYYGNGKDTLCGKLNVMPLDKKEVNLVLVPLNGFKTSNIKATDIEAYLNIVYKQTNIAYKVNLDYAFSSASADLPLSVEHGKLEGEYSANQANAITEYQVRQPEQDNTIYLFLCKEGSNDAVKGHTPVNRSYGFLFGENIDRRTIAHEVGHGYPLAMEHPFTTGGATGTFSNLMDYASGTNLTFMQWGKAHNPKLKVRFGQSTGQGLALQNDGLFMAPDGTVFEIPEKDGNFSYWAIELIPNGPILKLTKQANLDEGIDPNSVFEYDKSRQAYYNKYKGEKLDTRSLETFSERFAKLGDNAGISSYCETINVVAGRPDKPIIVNHRFLLFKTKAEYDNFETAHKDDGLTASYNQSRVTSCIKKVYRSNPRQDMPFDLISDEISSILRLEQGCAIRSASLSVSKEGFSIGGMYGGNYSIWVTKTGNKAPPTTPTLATTSDQIKDKYKNVSNSKVAGSKVSILENGILLTIDEKGNKTVESDPAKIQVLKASIQSGNITGNSQVLVESKMVDGKVVHDVTFGLKSGITPQKAGFKPLTETERQSLQAEVKKKMEDFLKKSSSDNLATIQPKTTDPNAFETDGSKTVVKEASIIEMISGVTKTAGELLEKCAIPASVYDSKDAGYQKSIFNTSPFACGLGNGMVDELKSIPQLVLLATDIALKEEVRDALVQQFKALTPSKVGSALVGFGKQTLGTIAGSSDKDYHDKGKMTFELATLIFGGVAGKADDALKAGDDAVTSFGTIASKIDDAAGSPYKIFIAQTKNLRKLFAQLNPSQIKADDLNKFVDRLNALPQGQARKDLFEALDASDVQLDELDGYIKAVEADPSKLTKEKWEEFRKDNISNKGDVGTYTTKIKWGILEVDARPFGNKGYWGKRVPQKDARVDAFELKVNPNNESFFVEHPNGGFVQFEGLNKNALQDGKLVLQPNNSMYNVYDKPEFLRQKVLDEAIRQTQAANIKGLTVEWLVSDKISVDQLTRFFAEKNVNIIVKYLAE